MTYLQNITASSKIVNKTIIGKQIQKFAKNKFKYMFEEYSHGFLDGGCYLFARVIKEKFKAYNASFSSVGREIIYHNDKPIADGMDHIIVRIEYNNNIFYIDADGIGAKKDLINKMEILEDCKNSIIKDNLSQEEIDMRINPYKGSLTESVLFEDIEKINFNLKSLININNKDIFKKGI